MRKPLQPTVSRPAVPTETSEADGPPAKKPRLRPEYPADVENTTPAAGRPVKPVTQLKKGVEPSAGSGSPGDATGDRYFNVLWYVQSTLLYLAPM